MSAIEDIHTERSGDGGPSVRVLQLEKQLVAAHDQLAGIREYVVHKGYCDFVLRQLPYCTCGLDKVLSAASKPTDED